MLISLLEEVICILYLKKSREGGDVLPIINEYAIYVNNKSNNKLKNKFPNPHKKMKIAVLIS